MSDEMQNHDVMAALNHDVTAALNQVVGGTGIGLAPVDPYYKKITLERHKQLTALSYEVEEFMFNKLGSEPLFGNEVCLFGTMMQSILQIRSQK